MQRFYYEKGSCVRSSKIEDDHAETIGYLGHSSDNVIDALQQQSHHNPTITGLLLYEFQVLGVALTFST